MLLALDSADLVHSAGRLAYANHEITVTGGAPHGRGRRGRRRVGDLAAGPPVRPRARAGLRWSDRALGRRGSGPDAPCRRARAVVPADLGGGIRLSRSPVSPRPQPLWAGGPGRGGLGTGGIGHSPADPQNRGTAPGNG